MNKVERDAAFKEKLSELGSIVNEINELSRLYYPMEGDKAWNRMRIEFGQNGRIYENIREVCRYYGVDFNRKAKSDVVLDQETEQI